MLVGQHHHTESDIKLRLDLIRNEHPNARAIVDHADEAVPSP